MKEIICLLHFLAAGPALHFLLDVHGDWRCVCRSNEAFESDWSKILAARKDSGEGEGGGGPPVLAMSVEEMGASNHLADSSSMVDGMILPGGNLDATSSGTSRFMALATSVERPHGSAPEESPASTSGKLHLKHFQGFGFRDS
jgi:hypothetical protein